MKCPFSMAPFQETCQFLEGYLNSFWFQQKNSSQQNLTLRIWGMLTFMTLGQTKKWQHNKGWSDIDGVAFKRWKLPSGSWLFSRWVFKFHHETWGEIIQFNEERVVDMFVAAWLKPYWKLRGVFSKSGISGKFVRHTQNFTKLLVITGSWAKRRSCDEMMMWWYQGAKARTLQMTTLQVHFTVFHQDISMFLHVLSSCISDMHVSFILSKSMISLFLLAF